MKLNLAEKNVVIHGAEVMLTNREFEILYLLAQSPGRIFSKEQIYDIVWQEPYSGDYNIVMSHIHPKIPTNYTQVYDEISTNKQFISDILQK